MNPGDEGYILLILGAAGGAPCPEAGHYVQDMDFEAAAGRGFLTLTRRPLLARRFASMSEALAFIKTAPAAHPVRLTDGAPNRPLTAFHIEIMHIRPHAGARQS